MVAPEDVLELQPFHFSCNNRDCIVATYIAIQIVGMQSVLIVMFSATLEH